MEGQNQQHEIVENNDELQHIDGKDDHMINEQKSLSKETENGMTKIASSDVGVAQKQLDEHAQKDQGIQDNKEDQTAAIKDNQSRLQKDNSQIITQNLEMEPAQSPQKITQSIKQTIETKQISEQIEDDLNQQTLLTKNQQQADTIQQKEEEQSDKTQNKQNSPQKPQSGQADEQSNMFIAPNSNNQTVTQPNYGNNYVLFKNKYIFITIGPDCIFYIMQIYVSFLHLYSSVLLAFCSYLSSIIMWKVSLSRLLQVQSALDNVFPILSWLCLTLEQLVQFPLLKKVLIKTSFCRKCRFDVPKNSYHCSYCDVCILGYDHHCPWTSKCVGRRNLIKFYFFLFMTPIYIVYCAFAFGFTVQSNDKLHQNLRKVVTHKL